jgi:hypothetical protein
MYENIIYIIFIIILLFFISNEEKINSFFSKKYFKILFLLLIIYFVYEKYNLLYLMILLLIIMILNIDWNRFKNNKYLKNIGFINSFVTPEFCKYAYKQFTNRFAENFISDSNNSPRTDQSPILSQFNVVDFVKEINTLKKKSELFDGNTPQKIEPFKENVENIKELYDNIQNEINKLKEGNQNNSS